MPLDLINLLVSLLLFVKLRFSIASKIVKSEFKILFESTSNVNILLSIAPLLNIFSAISRASLAESIPLVIFVTSKANIFFASLIS